MTLTPYTCLLWALQQTDAPHFLLLMSIGTSRLAWKKMAPSSAPWLSTLPTVHAPCGVCAFFWSSDHSCSTLGPCPILALVLPLSLPLQQIFHQPRHSPLWGQSNLSKDFVRLWQYLKLIKPRPLQSNLEALPKQGHLGPHSGHTYELLGEGGFVWLSLTSEWSHRMLPLLPPDLQLLPASTHPSAETPLAMVILPYIPSSGKYIPNCTLWFHHHHTCTLVSLRTCLKPLRT